MDNNKEVFFEIIIPNYNNIAYIKRCIDSILKQSFQDFCIIVVDDLSTDLSDKLASAYARKYPDKIIFKQLKEKGYAGAARNVGLDCNIKSKYTWFIDSDDFLASNYVLESMHKAIILYKYPDLLRCSYIDGTPNGRLIKLDANVKHILSDGAGPFKSCIKSCFNMRFVENRARNNDVIWFMKIMDSINFNKIASISTPCVVYNRQSLTSCQNNKKVSIQKQCIDADRLLVEDLTKISFKKDEVNARKNRVKLRYSNLYKPIISIDDAMKHSLVISIDKKRYIAMCKLFQHFGFNTLPKLLFGSTFKNKSGPFNCKHSHMRAVQHAKKYNWPYVMIFEDDAYPCDDVIHKMEMYLYALPKDASLVLFGWSHSYAQRFDKPFNKIIENAISGSHAYIIFEQAYDKFISYHKNNPEKYADNMIFKEINPSYVIDYPLFIQYTNSKSMNGHTGFVYYGNKTTPPIGFSIQK